MSRRRTRASNGLRLAGMAVAAWLLCSGAALATVGTPAPVTSASTQAESIDYHSAPKFAVVIGNTRYPGRYALHNAENDARRVAARLKQAGFATDLLINTDRGTLYQALGRLAETMKAGGAAAFYYAGHGMQIRGRNYLIPVDAPLDRPDALSQTALPVDYLISRLKDSGAHLSLVMLDACRNDPEESGLGGAYRGAGAPAGFIAQKPANGMLVAYATQPGERALDGRGANGPFALALSNWLTRPGMPIEDVMKHVMTDVRASTHDEQRPWIATSLIGDFALVPAANTQARLMLARPGRNVDGTPARGAAPSSGETAPVSTADGKPLLQWFQTAGQEEQMAMAQQIEREAKGVNRDDLPRLERQARGGNVMAASVLGTAYRNGFGAGTHITRSNTIAMRWFRLAAAQDMPYALNELGEMYFLGHGTTRDVAQARRYYEAAAAQGYMTAKLNLFQLQAESGQVTPQSLMEMFNAATRAAARPGN
ncbi:caspase family protein [Ralstonia pickettii]|uniref:caspase family protein n=1 Tax=Ralstonia pickettii TaxID=329 RepID=UPI000AB301FA|nr:caspase family protein [Ralstonia pickettii]